MIMIRLHHNIVATPISFRPSLNMIMIRLHHNIVATPMLFRVRPSLNMIMTRLHHDIVATPMSFRLSLNMITTRLHHNIVATPMSFRPSLNIVLRLHHDKPSLTIIVIQFPQDMVIIPASFKPSLSLWFSFPRTWLSYLNHSNPLWLSLWFSFPRTWLSYLNHSNPLWLSLWFSFPRTWLSYLNHSNPLWLSLWFSFPRTWLSYLNHSNPPWLSLWFSFPRTWLSYLNHSNPLWLSLWFSFPRTWLSYLNHSNPLYHCDSASPGHGYHTWIIQTLSITVIQLPQDMVIIPASFKPSLTITVIQLPQDMVIIPESFKPSLSLWFSFPRTWLSYLNHSNPLYHCEHATKKVENTQTKCVLARNCSKAICAAPEFHHLSHDLHPGKSDETNHTGIFTHPQAVDGIGAGLQLVQRDSMGVRWDPGAAHHVQLPPQFLHQLVCHHLHALPTHVTCQSGMPLDFCEKLKIYVCVQSHRKWTQKETESSERERWNRRK